MSSSQSCRPSCSQTQICVRPTSRAKTSIARLSPKGHDMSEAFYRQGLVPDSGVDTPIRYYRRDFWSRENLKFSKTHFRREKAVRIITYLAAGRDIDLLKN